MAEKAEEKLLIEQNIDRLLAAHDGDMALLYLYRVRHPRADLEQAAGALCRTMGELRQAEEKLSRLLAGSEGPSSSPPVIRPEPEPIQYTAQEIAAVLESKKNFEDVRSELQRVLGATPGRAFLNVLVDLYDHLGMPSEVIMLLINHCQDELHRRYGSERHLTPAVLSKEGYFWADRELITLEQAEDFLRRRNEQREEEAAVAKLLGIRGRAPVDTEGKYIRSWLDMGFPGEAVAIAYDRTMTNTGSLKWPYMDRILRSWHEKGLHSPEEIRLKDAPRRKAAAPAASTPADVDLRELEKALNEL